MNDHLEFDNADPFDDKSRKVPVIPIGIIAKTPKAKHRDEYKNFHTQQFAAMDDKALAQWQSQYEKDEPQWKLAEHEFQMRGSKPTRRIAIAAIVVSICSLIISILSYFFPHQ